MTNLIRLLRYSKYDYSFIDFASLKKYLTSIKLIAFFNNRNKVAAASKMIGRKIKITELRSWPRP